MWTMSYTSYTIAITHVLSLSILYNNNELGFGSSTYSLYLYTVSTWVFPIPLLNMFITEESVLQSEF